MALKKPSVKTITADISTLSIYIRSQKKFGKSTLFKNVILAKYGNPSNGFLIELGHESGDSLLDNVNSEHYDTWEELVELKDWLVEEKGKEHDIKIVAFDVADELVPMAEKYIVKLHNKENPQKRVKSVRQAFGGYNQGVEMAAMLIKDYISELRRAGFGVWVIAHSKLKTVVEKGSIDSEGYSILTSNLMSTYESAFGDIFDLVLTGYIDREYETVGEGDNAKRVTTSETRKLFFRGNGLIDAGSRFPSHAVPEYIIFDKNDMGKDFVKVIEDGIEKSKTLPTSTEAPKKAKKAESKKEEPKPVEEEPIIEDNIAFPKEEPAEIDAATLFEENVNPPAEDDLDIDEIDLFDDEDDEPEKIDINPNMLLDLYKSASKDKQKGYKPFVTEKLSGKKLGEMSESELKLVYEYLTK